MSRVRIITIPRLHWTAALLFLPALWLILHAHLWHRRHVATSRRQHNHCDHCNYDLRATPDRCPECGHTPTPA